MRILVTEAQRGDGRMVGALLAIEGHHMSFCHEPGEQAGPCVGMAPGGRCPLLAESIDAVVDVRLEGGQMSTREFGALCAAQSGTPLVVAGSVPRCSPLMDLAYITCPPGTVGDACAGIEAGRLHVQSSA